MATHYEVLGVEPDAGFEEIQRAYRLLALRHHPDVAPDADPSTMAAINGAWSVLSDPVRRHDYDFELGRPDPPARPAPPRPEDGWQPLDVDDEADPETLSDEPYAPAARRPSDMLVMTPVLLALGAVGLFFFSIMAGSSALRTLSMVLVPVSGVGFVMAPLMVMLRSRDRSGE
ncbi:MAG TPA: J domain-containing protein [Acidimicrobiales bacterium]|nr:J domain-containing protein [Acidimicrobiales bacterium]